MKKSVISTLVLVCICAVMAVLLAVTNAITAPIIEKNATAAANEALLQVMPDGEGFEKMEFDAEALPKTITEVYKEKNGGYVFQIKTTGYSSDFIIMCGVKAEGTISGAVCLSSTETLGHEKTFGANFTGKDAAGVDAVDTISGATKTTSAYKNAMKDALNAAIILGGGSVDLRDEAQILNDNLSAALPAGEGKFTKLFITEVIEGIDAVYIADNGKGSVYVVGEHFIPVDENGGIPAFSSVNPEILQNVAAADVILSATTTEDVDITAFEGLPSQLISAKKTATGNYIIEIKGAGYGINGGDDYHPASGEYIVIRVSLTPEGKIIDTLTVSQAETQGIGDACADEKFYGQFDGKTEADFGEIDAISGATLTTNGYKKAIERAFNVVKILEGGNNE
ncbi:MAG: FMN-binding protein [Clostridia bacterium]|nr:FMN-binding protein [Clostridia bacterium]